MHDKLSQPQQTLETTQIIEEESLRVRAATMASNLMANGRRAMAIGGSLLALGGAQEAAAPAMGQDQAPSSTDPAQMLSSCKREALNMADDGVSYNLLRNSHRRIKWAMVTGAIDPQCSQYGSWKVTFRAQSFSQRDRKMQHPVSLARPYTLNEPVGDKIYRRNQTLSRPINNPYNRVLRGWVKTVWNPSDAYGGKTVSRTSDNVSYSN